MYALPYEADIEVLAKPRSIETDTSSIATGQKVTIELARMRMWRRAGDEREAERCNARINDLLVSRREKGPTMLSATLGMLAMLPVVFGVAGYAMVSR